MFVHLEEVERMMRLKLHEFLDALHEILNALVSESEIAVVLDQILKREEDLFREVTLKSLKLCQFFIICIF